MPIHKPSRVLLHNVPLKFVHNRVAGGGRKAADAQVVLVPLIDFLITLVVFLLTSFSASGELLAQQPNLKMPDAKNVIDLMIAPILAINPEVITLDGEFLVNTADLTATPEIKPNEELISRLENKKNNWSILHPSEDFVGTVIIQADMKIDVLVIKKIMLSSAMAGYANLSFAVNQIGGD